MASSIRNRFDKIREKARLKGDEDQREQTDRWSNRDLIPLPPHRRTWGKSVYDGGVAILRRTDALSKNNG